MESTDPRELLVEIAKRLERLGIPYIVTGGMAVYVWGRPRFTADIDIVIELKPEHIGKLETALRELGAAGYFDPEAARAAIQLNGEFNFIDGTTGVKVDFWTFHADAFDRSRLMRRVPKTILGTAVYFTTPEDLILIKTKWYRDTLSDKQAEDVRSIVAVSGAALDRAYLAAWAQRLGITDALDKLVKL